MRRHLLFSLFALLLLGCETDSYDKGQGKYSLMQADFGILSVNGQKQAASFVTDEGDSYQFTTPITAKWIETADTTYRAIIYYNKVESGQAEGMGIASVVTFHPVPHWRFKELKQDPIGFESAWLAKSGKYLNVGLLLKSGRIDDEEHPHTIGLAQDTVFHYADGRRSARYRLLHNQNGIPEYYTNRHYISIALPQPKPDTIRLTIQTYEGAIERTFVP